MDLCSISWTLFMNPVCRVGFGVFDAPTTENALMAIRGITRYGKPACIGYDKYHNKPGVSGPRGYSPKTMAATCMPKEAEKKTFRGISGHIKSHRELQKKLGLDTVPSKNAIHGAYSPIPESYLDETHARIVRDVKTAHAAMQAIKRRCEKHSTAFSQTDPKFTSQKCPTCDHTSKENRNDQYFACTKCDYSDDADANIVKHCIY